MPKSKPRSKPTLKSKSAKQPGDPRNIPQYGCRDCPDLRLPKERKSASHLGTTMSMEYHVEKYHSHDKDNWRQYVVTKEPKKSVWRAKEWKVLQARRRAAATGDNEEGEEGEEEEEEDKESEVDLPPTAVNMTAFDNAALAGDYGNSLAFLAAQWRSNPEDSVCESSYKMTKADYLDGKHRSLIKEASDLVIEVRALRKVCREYSSVFGRVAAAGGVSKEVLMMNYGGSEEGVAAMREIDAAGDEEEDDDEEM